MAEIFQGLVKRYALPHHQNFSAFGLFILASGISAIINNQPVTIPGVPMAFVCIPFAKLKISLKAGQIRKF